MTSILPVCLFAFDNVGVFAYSSMHFVRARPIAAKFSRQNVWLPSKNSSANFQNRAIISVLLELFLVSLHLKCQKRRMEFFEILV